jgi:hypothetical protein
MLADATVMPTAQMIPVVMIIRIFGTNVWFVPDLSWYNREIGPKGWDDPDRMDGSAYRT